MLPIWTPSPERVAASNLTAFTKWLRDRGAGDFADYKSLHDWSITDRGAFWSSVWDFFGVIGLKGETAVIDGGLMPGAKFFPEARLNFAENLLRRRDASPALLAYTEPDTAPGSGRT